MILKQIFIWVSTFYENQFINFLDLVPLAESLTKPSGTAGFFLLSKILEVVMTLQKTSHVLVNQLI
jgi:hypothetical protein